MNTSKSTERTVAAPSPKEPLGICDTQEDGNISPHIKGPTCRNWLPVAPSPTPVSLPPLGKSRTFWTSDASEAEVELCRHGGHPALMYRLLEEREEQLAEAQKQFAQRVEGFQEMQEADHKEIATLNEECETAESSLSALREAVDKAREVLRKLKVRLPLLDHPQIDAALSILSAARGEQQ